MSSQAYLIDTNVIIGLEDDHTVQPAFAGLTSIAAKHKVDVLVHEAARDTWGGIGMSIAATSRSASSTSSRF